MGCPYARQIHFKQKHNFLRVNWTKPEDILDQTKLLLQSYEIRFAKIGLIENLELGHQLVCLLHEQQVKTIWDPILKTSTGFSLHGDRSENELQSILKKLFLITPNWNEIQKLVPETSPTDGAKKLSGFCAVYLKGGHNEQDKGRDYLFENGKLYPFRPKGTSPAPKHGSGCVLSAAIAANLAHGFDLRKACLRAKSYTYNFLQSNTSLLGYHNI